MNSDHVRILVSRVQNGEISRLDGANLLIRMVGSGKLLYPSLSVKPFIEFLEGENVTDTTTGSEYSAGLCDKLPCQEIISSEKEGIRPTDGDSIS